MSPTLALIPAKRHSSGVPDKNWKDLLGDEGESCVERAIRVGVETCDRTIMSTDGAPDWWFGPSLLIPAEVAFLRRPKDLPDAMIDVVRHALEQVPGPDDEIIVLLQPTSPLRTVATVQQAIEMLRADPTAHSVVSVSPTYPREWTLTVEGDGILVGVDGANIDELPSRRQDCKATYKRDGTVYAFRRRTVSEHGSIYGYRPFPLFTPPEESLSIDTPEDWDEAVRRLQARG